MFFYSRYIQESFVDLYPVASMRGVYLASQLAYGEVGTRAIYSVISFDKGRYWRRLNVPVRHADGSLVNCSLSVRSSVAPHKRAWYNFTYCQKKSLRFRFNECAVWAYLC